MTHKIKQCDNCEFWDHAAVEEYKDPLEKFNGRKYAECIAPRPFWANIGLNNGIFQTWEDVGQDCPVYKELQDESDDDDPPDENGYTQADEDWFFDAKD